MDFLACDLLCDDSVDAFAFFARADKSAQPRAVASRTPREDAKATDIFDAERALDASLVPKTVATNVSQSSVRLDVIAAMVFPSV